MHKIEFQPSITFFHCFIFKNSKKKPLDFFDPIQVLLINIHNEKYAQDNNNDEK